MLYPLGMLFARLIVDQGQLSFAGVGKIFTDRHQIQAFWNSLLLGTLVGVIGTVVGFVFAFVAARGRLPQAAE